jgi:uncharacterized protein
VARPGRGTRSLLVNVAPLLGRAGHQRRVETSATFDDLRLSTAWVEPDAEVGVDLVLEAVLGGRLTVDGTVTARWVGECRRCLGPIHGELVAEVHEVFTEPDAVGSDDPDLLPLDGMQVDLEPVVREAVLLGLPIAPLCGDDCPGPAPDVAAVLPADAVVDASGDEPAEGDDRPPDPRWAALDQLHFDED